jgi:hypothetical protein
LTTPHIFDIILLIGVQLWQQEIMI